MSASATSPEDVVNLALARIGFKERVTNLYEGTPAAAKALDIYAQTRDELLRKGDWDFAERDAALVLQKSAPLLDSQDPTSGRGYLPGVTAWDTTCPALPWTYQYAYPADCLQVRAVRPVPTFLVDMDPRPHRFEIDNDSTIPAKVILSNVSGAVASYTAQVTDPTMWEADFIEALSAALGRRLAPALVGLESARMELPDEAQAEQTAEERQG